MKKNLLYIGNKLSKHGLNKTTIETLGKSLEKEGFSIFYASEKKNFFLRILDMIFTLFKVYKKIDYIVIDTYSTKAFWYCVIMSQLARFFKIKYIPILHGGNLPVRLKKNPVLCKLIFKNAFKNVAPSNYLKNEFEKAGFDNIIHIPNTIDIDSYTFKKREFFTPNLLWVRAFASIYNPKMAVEVLYELKKIYPEATLTMVGPDKDGSLLETKTRANELGVIVNFTGKLDKKTWWQLAAEHDIFISTTHFDNTPVSVIEAMALGLPVVSTNVGGIPYLLTDNKNAFLVNDNDVNEMTNVIENVIKNTNKTIEITLEGRKLAESLDWEIVKNYWISLLE